MGQCPGTSANEALCATHHREEQPSRANQAAPANASGFASLRATTREASTSCQGQGTGCSREPPDAQARPKPGSTCHRARLARLAATPASATVAQWSASTSPATAKSSLVHIGNQALPQSCNLTQRSSGHAPAGRCRPSFHSGPSPRCLREPLMSNVRLQNTNAMCLPAKRGSMSALHCK